MSNIRYRFAYEAKSANLLAISLLAITPGQGDAEDNRETLASVELDVSRIPETLTTAGGEQKSVFMYGAQKLLQDRTASMNAATETDAKAKLEKIQEVFASLVDGKWSEGRESTGTTGGSKSQAIKDTLLAKAIAELTGKPELAVMAALASKNKEEKKALAASDSIAPVIARLEEEMAAVDLSDLGL